MERCAACVYLVLATTVAGQFFDFPQFSPFLPAANDRRIPTFQQQPARKTNRYSDNTQVNNDLYSEGPRQDQRKPTKTPTIASNDRDTNSETISNHPSSRVTSTTTTKQGLSFHSFIDVSPGEGQFFRGQKNSHGSSQTTERPAFGKESSRTRFKQTTENPDRPLSDETPSFQYSYEKSPKMSTSRPQTNQRPQNQYYQNDQDTRPVLNQQPSPDYVNGRPNIVDYNRPNEYDNEGPDNVDYHRPNTYERPGVLRPNIDESRAPITNRPPYIGGSVQGGDGGFVFPGDDDGPQLTTGPDEDLMSEDQKRRAIQTSERMCQRYKTLNTEQLSAIPLIPSPSPVTVDVAKCAPLNVPLVVGGQVVTIGQYPHMAALGWKKIQGRGYSWKCGGSLVSERYVLTAAHCSYQDRDNTVISGPPRVVQLGADRLNDPAASVISVEAVVRHPKYKAPASYNDIALLKLAKMVSFSDHIRPACLGDPPSAGDAVITTGWGRTEFGGETSEELRGVSLPVWDISECARALGTSRKLPNGPSRDSQICAGDLQGGKDTCQGDSGGPAQVADSCTWRVVGVTSVGRACGAPRTPALYARPSRAFIASVVWN